MSDLALRMNALCDAQPFDTGWCLEDLVSGRTLDRGGDVIGPSASTRKISVMMAALSAVHEGRFGLDDPVAIDASLQEGIVSGVAQYLTPGLTIPMRDAILLMIIVSDNVSTFRVMERLGLDVINAYCRSIGLAGTTHRSLVPPLGLSRDHPVEAVTTTTPRDLVRLLRMILDGSGDDAAAQRLGVTSALCRLALDILSKQRLRYMLPALLPDAAVVASKTGVGNRGHMDAGIVFRDGRPIYILAVVTDQVPDTMPRGLPGRAAAADLIARLSRLCWDAIA